MVSKDKGLNVVAQLTGMGINEQLCCPHLLAHIISSQTEVTCRAQQAMIKGCNTGSASLSFILVLLFLTAATVEEAMEWIDEEEQRRKKAAPIEVSASAAAISPQVGCPLTLDDFMSQWLHPNWSHVSCVARMHLSPEQVPPSRFLSPREFVLTLCAA